MVAGAVALHMYFTDINASWVQKDHRVRSEATMGSYSATLWPRYSGAMVSNQAADLTSYQAETRAFFQSQPLAKLTIFSPDVKRLYYSSTDSFATDENAQRIPLFDMAQVRAGQVVSRMLPGSYFSATPGEPRTLVHVIVPILKPGTQQVEAIAEIYRDVTEQWRQVQLLEYRMIGAIVATFLLMIVLLIFTARRGEAIITRQHEVNLELTAAAAQAEAQSHDKSQFLAGVSHELRTPLNSIIGFSDILRNEVKSSLDKVYQEYIDDIHASGRHLLSLINDILDYSKAEAGKLQVEWAETDATKIIRNSLRMVLPRAEAAQVTLIEDIPNHHLIVVTDAKKLKQVLLNLLSNAVKFTRAGGEVRCQAWTDITNGALTIVVKDTGIGIAPKDISKVMTPFGQVDSVLSRKYEGTGLGLPLSKKFIESMGGTFLITSELNVGTAVTVTIPKAPHHWQMSEPLQPEEKTHVASTDTGNTAS